MTAPPGWYPDPTNPLQIRYRDGLNWTDQTGPAVPYTYTAPVYQVVPVAPPTPALGNAGYILGLSSAIVALAVFVVNSLAIVLGFGAVGGVVDVIGRLLSVVWMALGSVAAVLAIIFGHVGVSEARRGGFDPWKAKRSFVYGYAAIGIVLLQVPVGFVLYAVRW